jgi:Tc toxin complex TcA C-terminal TcB-binding domain
MFETNLREERLLPFEGAGAESTWILDLPKDFRQFDYNTIADVKLHVRYTARQGGAQMRDKAVEHLKELTGEANSSGLALLFSLKEDFPNEWYRFVTGTENFEAMVKRDHFPYFTQGKDITINAIQLHALKGEKLEPHTPPDLNFEALTTALNDKDKHAFELSLTPDGAVLERKNEALIFVIIRFSF